MRATRQNTKLAVRSGSTVLVLLFTAAGANACAVCMGSADSTVGAAMNAAIFALLAIVGAVLLAFGGFIFYLVRRAKMPLAPHQELAHMVYREGLQEGSK